MLDIKWIRENPLLMQEALVKRGTSAGLARETVEALTTLEQRRRENLATLQAAQERRNAVARDIGKAMAAKDVALAERLKAEVTENKVAIQDGEVRERELDQWILDIAATLPNIPHDDVPVGANEDDNKVVDMWSEKPLFDFGPKEHFEIGEAMGLMDFEGARALAGSRFTVLKGDLARLERALGQFMLDLHTEEHGYTEVQPPLMVRDEVMFGTGQLPKFADDLFKTTDGRWLIPTAEVPLTNLVRDRILDVSEFPVRMTALTPCFRSEAGSAGRDQKGMLRQHQFNKVELVSIVEAEMAAFEHERMTECAMEVLKRLGLPFRAVLLCTGDMGFGARKTYDIEVWLPGQNAYREISSVSDCGDFQGRRMNARYRVEGEKDKRFVHTLNGSGVAVGRALIAVMENYQNEDGSVTVPEVLKPYMATGKTKIS